MQALEKQQTGFTLIELVIVIVILGVLAAFALPRFADLGNEARTSSLQGLEGVVVSTVSQFRTVCAVQSSTNCGTGLHPPVTLSAYGATPIRVVGGYPEAGSINNGQWEIDDLVDTSGFEVSNPNGSLTRWSVSGVSDCYLEYRQMQGGETNPLITVVDTGC
jgi:MSHA pilin protein MshA